jgi:hypothetical protein
MNFPRGPSSKGYERNADALDLSPALGAGARGYLFAHGDARRHGRDHRTQHHPADAARLHRSAGVDPQRLHADVRRPADDGRGVGRSLRQTSHAYQRPGAVHAWIGWLRPGTWHRLADRRASRARRGRRADHAAGHGAAQCRLSARPPSQGLGVVQQHHRPGAHLRTGVWRRGSPGAWPGSGSSG